jgi:hypothetical protein
MNEITWHESAIWFFIAQKLLFANQYVRKCSENFKMFKKFQNVQKISKGLGAIRAKIGPTSDVDKMFSKMYSQYVLFRNKYS